MAAEATAAVVMVVEMVVEATEAVVKGTAVEEAVEREGSGGGTNCSHSIACCRRLSNGLLACARLVSPRASETSMQMMHRSNEGPPTLDVDSSLKVQPPPLP